MEYFIFPEWQAKSKKKDLGINSKIYFQSMMLWYIREGIPDLAIKLFHIRHKRHELLINGKYSADTRIFSNCSQALKIIERMKVDL